MAWKYNQDEITVKGVRDVNLGFEVLTAAKTLTAADSHKTYFLDLAAGFAVTLPALALGLQFTFVAKTAPSSGSYTIVAASGTPIKGHVLTNDVNSGTDSDFGTAGELTITLVQAKAVAGDRVTVVCDGTNWHMQAACSVFDAITLS